MTMLIHRGFPEDVESRADVFVENTVDCYVAIFSTWQYNAEFQLFVLIMLFITICLLYSF